MTQFLSISPLFLLQFGFILKLPTMLSSPCLNPEAKNSLWDHKTNVCLHSYALTPCNVADSMEEKGGKKDLFSETLAKIFFYLSKYYWINGLSLNKYVARGNK